VPSNPTVSVALALALATLTRPGHAAELTAKGPAGCADAVEISFRVERSIGMPLAQAAPLAFDVALERDADGYVARIQVTGAAPGAAPLERVLAATDCDKLVDAVSVAVALALGMGESNAEGGAAPNTGGEAAASTGAQPGASSGARSSPPSAASDAGRADPAAAASTGLAPSLSLWLLGDAGSLPSPSLGAALGAELGWRSLELRALGTLLFEQETAVTSLAAPAAGAKLQLWTGALLACNAPFGNLRAPLAPFVCVGVELGRLSGVGTGVASPLRGGALWAAPLVQVGGSWALPDTSLQLGAALSAAAPLNRDEFALREIGTVHQPPSVVGRLSVSVGVGFD
jgi:hypothetical protein